MCWSIKGSCCMGDKLSLDENYAVKMGVIGLKMVAVIIGN